jgi:hypothetical protein
VAVYSYARTERDGRRLLHHHVSAIRRFFHPKSTAFHIPTYRYLFIYDFKAHLTLEAVSNDGARSYTPEEGPQTQRSRSRHNIDVV